MELAHIPQQAELSALYGSWNPLGYMEGMRNQGIADQFRQQGSQANDLELAKMKEANAQAAQMNPLLLAHQGLVNTGQGLTNEGAVTKNASSALDFSNKQALNDDQMAADRAKLRQQYSDAEIAEMNNKVLQKHMENVKSGNLVEIQKTGKLLDFLGGAGAVADRQSRQQIADNNNATQVKTTGMHTASSERINQANIDAGKYNRNKTAVSIQTQLMKAKTPTEKAEILEEAYYTADAAGDAEAANIYKARAQEARARVAEDARNRGLAQPRLDVGAATGMPMASPPAATAPIAGGGSPAPSPSKQLTYNPQTGKFE